MLNSANGTDNLGNIGDCEAIPFPELLESWWDSLPSEVHFISNLISKNSGGCWIVGGSIRDGLCSNLKIDEIDLATDLIPNEITRIFNEANFQENITVVTLPTGEKYGTMTLRFGTGIEIEITTLRTDSSYSDGRRPDTVRFGKSLKEDLLRRDFTVNALAVDVSRKILHDPYGGLSDIRSKTIRAVGDPNIRLSEDGLRILRAYRFMGNFKSIWNLEDSLRSSLKISINMLGNVAMERIWNELKKILAGKHAGTVLSIMSEDNILDVILHGTYRPKSRGIVSQLNPILTPYSVSPIARLSLLLVDSWNNNITNDFNLIRLSNNEVRDFNRIFSSLGRLPNPKSKGELRMWRHYHDSKENEDEMLALEESLATLLGAEKIALIISIREELLALLPLSAGNHSLVNGNWLMQRTGLAKGPRLGKLKSWLHTIQIERDLSNLGEIESVLCTLPWNQENYAMWPSPVWPK